MKLNIDFECPDCGSSVGATLEDVANQRTVRCRRGHSVRLVDEGGGARKATTSIDDLERTLKRLGQ